MKILHFYNGRCHLENLSGVPKTVSNLARYQSKIGHDVSLCNLTSKPVLEIGDAVRVRNFKPTFGGWRISDELKSAILDLSPDVIHLHSAYVPSNAAVARFARRHKIPYVTTPNGNLSPLLLQRKPWFKAPYRLMFELPVHQGASFIHSINDKDDIRAYGVTVPMVIAPNGMELDNSPLPEDVFLDGCRFHEGQQRILFLGRLDVEQKGLDLLLEGFAKLSPENAVLILAGPSWKDGHERLEKLSVEKGIRDKVVFWGGIFGEEKRSMLRHADFFVHTSRWEAGIPFSVLEALAAGLPVLATKAADPAMRIPGVGAGINSEMDTDSIAEALGDMLKLGAGERARMGRNAKRLIEEEFSWQTIASKICEGYEKHCIKGS